MAIEPSPHRRSSPPPARDEHFPFLSLPAELRLYVYRICLKRSSTLLLHMARPVVEKSEEEDEEEKAAAAIVVGQVFDMIRTPAGAQTTLPSHPGLTNTGSKEEMDDAPACEDDPLIPEVLRLNKQIYREARPSLYAENEFRVRLTTAHYTLSHLHQRSRSSIKHIHITISSHHDILEGFADLVRLGLRYCWGLKVLHLTLTTVFPEESGVFARGPSVYANAFHILRWLPKSCKIELVGKVPSDVERIIRENERHAEVLDDTEYQKRQHQMSDRLLPQINDIERPAE